MHKLSIPSAIAIAIVTTTPSLGAAEPRTRVVLNGKVVPVTFNDGDSFRVLGGTFNGAKARLVGYNTLESYGPVHQWGTWTAKELYVIAKMAMKHAQRGVWTCTTDGKSDTYGRMLVTCAKLAEELVRLGYAHAMSVDDKPAKAELVLAQREAQRERRGLWAHGVPPFVLTSLHSVEEDTTGAGTYNRLVSSDDGHSVKWKHTDRYEECARVCQWVYEVDDAKIDELAAAMAADAKAAAIVGSLSDAQRREVAASWARYRHVARAVDKKRREDLAAILRTLDGNLGEPGRSEGACMIHVPFERRFGGGRAKCLH